MIDESTVGRVAASACILALSAAVIHIAVLRASTIYFFELDSHTVLFLSKRHALAFPLVLSALLTVVYYATKRSRQLERIREKEVRIAENEKDNPSGTRSRKVSRSADLRPIFEVPNTTADEMTRERLRRMLSDIEESHDPVEDAGPDDAVVAKIIEPKDGTPDEDEDLMRSNSSEKGDDDLDDDVEEAEDEELMTSISQAVGRKRMGSEATAGDRPGSRVQLAPPLETRSVISAAESRKSSIGSKTGLLRISRRNSVGEEMRPCDLYRELGQIDLLTYIVNAVSVFPENAPAGGGTVKRKVRLTDMLADLFAVHVPVWACVAALHVVLLELITVKFAFYFYYHEETMQYSALISSILFGIVHEFIGGWLTNDVLALASIYVVVSRVQLISFQAAGLLSGGLIAFDLFWIYVVDLLSTVTGKSRAPLMLAIPRDNKGNKQSLATLDIMAPGVVLNLLLKFNAMYDPKVYMSSYYAVIAGLTLTMGLAVYRRKITPALVLPLFGVMVTSLSVVDRPNDLWRFMIKH